MNILTYFLIIIIWFYILNFYIIYIIFKYIYLILL